MFKIFIFTVLMADLLFGSKTIKINLSKQKLYAIENGNIVFTGSVSTGKSGHRTPSGNFKVIDKERHHVSNKYPEPSGGAKMPYMHRLTNSGIAIHQGYLPGYPASHGCIRVSKNTAKKLWFWSRRGVRVKIYGDPSNYSYKKPARKKYSSKSRKKYRAKSKHIKKRSRKRAKSRRSYKRRVANYHRSSGYRIVEIYDSF